MITPKIEQALYIKDLIFEKQSIKLAMTNENYENLWIDSASSLPDHFHSESEPNYMEILMGLSGFSCQEDAPEEAIDKLREYINKKIDAKAQENLEFLKLRTTSLKSNIKYLKNKFKADWKVSYKVIIREIENVEIDGDITVKNLDVDDILDKINKKGINSLTEEEKKFLNKGKGDDKKDK